MKKSEEQPPNTQQKVLGVISTVRAESLMVEACPQRKQKVPEMLEDMQSSNSFTPDQAQRITGKLAFFVHYVLRGPIGRAALQPFLRQRAHGLVGNPTTTS